jgi:hypothetical protein
VKWRRWPNKSTTCGLVAVGALGIAGKLAASSSHTYG